MEIIPGPCCFFCALGSMLWMASVPNCIDHLAHKRHVCLLPHVLRVWQLSNEADENTTTIPQQSAQRRKRVLGLRTRMSRLPLQKIIYSPAQHAWQSTLSPILNMIEQNFPLVFPRLLYVVTSILIGCCHYGQ